MVNYRWSSSLEMTLNNRQRACTAKARGQGAGPVFDTRPESSKNGSVSATPVSSSTRGALTWREDDFQRLPKLKLIATCSVGTDSIDLIAARERGIVVSNQPKLTHDLSPNTYSPDVTVARMPLKQPFSLRPLAAHAKRYASR